MPIATCIDVCMPTKIEGLVLAEKSLLDVPAWMSRGTDGLDFSVPLEVDGVTVEAITLRGRARKPLPDREVIFQLEYHHAQIIGGPVARIEWRPLNAHNNKGVGPKHLRHIIQSGSHHHCFDLNWQRSHEAVLRGELPIAVPIDDPNNLRALLAVVGKAFRINNIQLITPPPWEPMML
jgi:hypothetical protein